MVSLILYRPTMGVCAGKTRVAIGDALGCCVGSLGTRFKLYLIVQVNVYE